MGRYLCWTAPRLHKDLPGDRRVLIAAAYRRSYRTVNAAGGVPPDVRAYADRIGHFLEVYAPPGKK